MTDHDADELHTRRRVSWVVVLVSGAALVVVAALRVPWHWLPGGHVTAVDPRDYFTAAQLRRADAYSSVQRALSLSSYAVSLVLALVLGLTRLGAGLMGHLRGWWWVRLTVGALLLLLLGDLVTMPLRLVLRHRALAAGLTNQSLIGWLRDDLVALAVGVVSTSIVVVLLVGLARRLPRAWPAWAALVAGTLVVLGSYVYPVIVEPLSNRFEPLPDGALRSSILRLAEVEHVHVDDVLVSDASRRTTELNAYVTGLGNTRRVVLWDNTVRDLPQDQIEAIVAHELGHAEHDDVLLGTVLGALAAAFGVGLLGLVLGPRLNRWSGSSGPGRSGPADVRVLPLLLALTAAATFAASPVQNLVSRAIEARADRTSLLATRDPSAFTAMQRRLALSGLDQPSPPRLVQVWFGSHPTTVERIGMARDMTQQLSRRD